MMDLAGPLQVFYEAGQLGGHRHRIRYVQAHDTVQTEQGLVLADLEQISQLVTRQGDLICVPGIDFSSFQAGVLDAAIATCRSWLREQYRQGTLVASICSGALILAKMGMLDRVQCTTHWKCIPYLRQQFPKAQVLENRLYCFDRNIYTSAGMTAGIDMALALIEKWDTPLVAARVAQEMVINVRRPETNEQRNTFLNFKNHFHSQVYRAQETLASRLDARYTIADLARDMHMSDRHLARLFKDHTGETIQTYRTRVRLERGEQLLRHSEKSVKEIAVACGFDNARHFARIWKQHHGATPGASRLAYTAAGNG